MITILIVDDEGYMRQLLTEILSNERHEVYSATNGKEALSLLDIIQVDLIITDIVMPDIDGLELIREIKNKEKQPVKIIAISGGVTGSGSYLNIAHQFGADAIVEKPFSTDDILEVVRQVMKTE